MKKNLSLTILALMSFSWLNINAVVQNSKKPNIVSSEFEFGLGGMQFGKNKGWEGFRFKT